MRSAILALILGGAAFTASAEPPPIFHVTDVFPSIVAPQGGAFVTISGGNFTSPSRVFFDQKEAFVVSITPTRIQVVTPSIDLPTSEQSRSVALTLISSAGTPLETRHELSQHVTYIVDRPEPRVTTLAPRAGPLTGGTRVTIFGDGFQSPVRVFFDDDEAQVLVVRLDQIVVIAPASSSVHPATIRITNINADKSSSTPDGYRYVAPMTFRDVVPDHGSFAGGTSIAIHGSGFVAPLAITIGGKPAAVIRVSDSEVLALTPAADPDCNDRAAGVTIANIDSGDSVDGVTFRYVAPHPAFTTIPRLIAGDSVSMKIDNEPDSTGKFTLGGRTIVAQSKDDGTFTFRIPATLVSCTGAPLQTTLTFTDAVTGCSISQAVVVEASRDCEPRSPRRGSK